MFISLLLDLLTGRFVYEQCHFVPERGHHPEGQLLGTKKALFASADLASIEFNQWCLRPNGII
jgi:hypothetical protein